jgi:hypothetical protein
MTQLSLLWCNTTQFHVWFKPSVSNVFTTLYWHWVLLLVKTKTRFTTAISAVCATTNPDSHVNISHRSLHITVISRPKQITTRINICLCKFREGCMMLTVWHCHLLPDNVTDCLGLSVTAWLPNTVRHCHCPTLYYCQTLWLPDSATYCLTSALAAGHFKLDLQHKALHAFFITASRPVHAHLRVMSGTSPDMRRFEWHCLSWRGAGVAQSE